MAELGLESVRRRLYKATTDSKHALPVDSTCSRAASSGTR